MSSLIIQNFRSYGWQFICDKDREVSDLRSKLFARNFLSEQIGDCVYLMTNGRNLQSGDLVKGGQYVYVLPRLLGGKGGFGSMLRAIGAQIEKTTNREACRDLSGRRLRDINEEMRLKKWITKQAEREQERAVRRRERLEKRLATPKYEFRDPAYDKQRSQLAENVTDALSQGLALEKSKSAAQKRSAAEKKDTMFKKRKVWLGSDDMSSSDDSSSDESSSSKSFCEGSDGTSCDDSGPGELADVIPKEIAKKNSIILAVGISMSESAASSSSSIGIQIKPETVVADSREQNLTEETHKEKVNVNIMKPEITEPLDLTKFDSVETLEGLGLEKLKLALMARGLKCGGTLKQRAERLFSIKGLTRDQINQSLLASKQNC